MIKKTDNIHEGLEKLALTGVVGEAYGLGVPSALGYAIGRSLPVGDKEEAEKIRSLLSKGKGRGGRALRDVAGGLFVPGYTGYRSGRSTAARVYLKKQKSRSRK